MPYVASGVGLAPNRTLLEVPIDGLRSFQQTTFTLNAGGGIELRLTENWGLRTGARWLNGVPRGAGDYWRVYYTVTFRAGR